MFFNLTEMYQHTITPRFGDADGLRHINNTVFPRWFEEAREPTFRLFVPDLSFERWNLIMAHLELDFHDVVLISHDVEIRTFISHLGNSSFTFEHEAWQEGRLTTTCHAVIVHYDFERKEAVPIPDSVRAELEKHLRLQETKEV